MSPILISETHLNVNSLSLFIKITSDKDNSFVESSLKYIVFSLMSVFISVSLDKLNPTLSNSLDFHSEIISVHLSEIYPR